MKKENKENNASENQEKEKKKKEYWGEDVELAVVEYLKNDFNFYRIKQEKYIKDCIDKEKDIDEYIIQELNNMIIFAEQSDVIYKKNEVFRKKIQKPLNRLIENIIFNYRLFRPGVDVKTLHNDCMSFVMEKFANFDPSQNTKSFSFYGTVAKHYLLGKKKEVDKGSKTNLDYCNHKEEVDNKNSFELDEINRDDSSYTLFNYIINELEKELDKKDTSKNDAKVADAIIQIFRNHLLIGAYNKNQVYQLIKEHTGLQTKDITYSLHRFRIFYKLRKQDYIKKENEDDLYDDDFDYDYDL